jgi:hypothetical protein
MEVDLTRSILKHLLKKTLYITDMEDLDPELSKHLLWMLGINYNSAIYFNKYYKENSIDGLDLG